MIGGALYGIIAGISLLFTLFLYFFIIKFTLFLWNNLGIEYSKNENYQEAITCYKYLLDLNHNDHEIWHNLACVYILINDYSQAVYCITKAIEIKPNTSEYYKLRSEYYLNINQHDLAAQDMDTIAKLEQ